VRWFCSGKSLNIDELTNVFLFVRKYSGIKGPTTNCNNNNNNINNIFYIILFNYYYIFFYYYFFRCLYWTVENGEER